MPAADTTTSNLDRLGWPRIIPKQSAAKQSSDPDLAHEVAQLRREIAELRRELAPAKSLILVGQQVLDEFKRLVSAHA